MMNINESIKLLKELSDKEIKFELKTTRKRNTKWININSIHIYPCPNQIVAIRNIKPRGIQKKWNDGKISTFIPKYKNKQYCWEMVEMKK